MRTSANLKSHQIYTAGRKPVDIDLDNGRLKVQRKRFDVDYREGDVRDLNGRVIAILEDIGQEVDKQRSLTLPDHQCNTFLTSLRDVGAEMYAWLPEGAGAYISALEADEPSRGLSLDCTFPPGMAFIWDLIYSGDPDADAPIEQDQFWGLRYPIGHLSWESDVPDTVRLRDGIFASWHDQLTHSKIELERLASRLDDLCTRQALQVILQHVEAVIPCDTLSSDEVLRFFHRSDFTYGIVHFACHCLHDPDAGASNASLCFTAHQRRIEIRPGNFKTRARHHGGFQHRPFVFLNACASATPLHLLQSLNFPNSLLNFGAGGVIATVCTIPDTFASAFADTFYAYLLDTHSTSLYTNIGEALLKTRLYFLEAYNNPLGLAYGLYALSNQQLQMG